jgi:peroxiredoxin
MEPEKTVAYSPGKILPLGAGDKIPFGTLRTPENKAVDFEGLLKGKPTLILFYQGEWSPFALEQLEQLAGLEPQLAGLGYQLIAISPDQPSKLKETLERERLNFPLFCDKLMDVTRRFGLAFRADRNLLRKKGIHLRKFTGNSRYVLPVPAIYGINSKGLIQFSFFDARYPLLTDPAELLQVAKGMVSE